MEHVPNLNQISDSHDKLKEEFLSGKITHEQSKERWFELDQAGDHIENAEKNIELLEDSEIKRRIMQMGDDVISKCVLQNTVNFLFPCRTKKYA